MADGMASLGPASPGPAPANPAGWLAEAERGAELAARAAGVRIRELSGLTGFQAACRLFGDIWQPDPAAPPMTAELLRALTKAGGYAAGAYRDGLLVGASAGFFGPPADRTLHSHITGVRGAGQGTGYALKLHQRAWSLHRDVTQITWTYDPLIRRNAYFNLVKLAARPLEYLPNFYGGMHDGINGGGDTDRLLVCWDLCSPVAAAPRTAAPVPGPAAALSVAADGGPVIAGPVIAGPAVPGPHILVAVPADIERLRAADPARASAWRLALRQVLAPAMAAGARITGFDRAGWYVVMTSHPDRAHPDRAHPDRAQPGGRTVLTQEDSQ